MSTPYTWTTQEVLDLFRGMIGKEFVWQPANPKAYCRIVVQEIVWNGEDILVRTFNLARPNQPPDYNTIEHFLESLGAERTGEPHDPTL